MLKFREVAKNHFTYIPLIDILPAIYQPRHYFESARLDELSRSIKRYGVLQPILVRRVGKKYEVIAGERRIRAASIAGLTKIPAIVCSMSDTDAAACALLENLQRENLSYLDESDGYIQLSKQEKYNISSLAYALCSSDDKIEEKMRYRRFSSDVRKLISYYKISEEHARLILRLGGNDMRIKVIKKIAENSYDVSQTSELVEKLISGEMPVVQPKKKYGSGDLRPFKNTLKQTVDIMKRSGVKATATEHDSEDCYEYTIRVEKAK